MSSLLQFFTTLEMFQEYYGSKRKYLQVRPIEFDTVKIVKIEEVRQMWTITTNGNITGSDTWCGFQLPLYFHLFFDICSVGFLISEVIVVCGCCCGHYLFDTLNTDRTRAGAHPITSYHRFYFSARCLICCKTRFNIQLLKIHNLDQSIELYCKSHNQGILNSKID